MKIKEWIAAIKSLGDEDMVIGGMRTRSGVIYFDLVLLYDSEDEDFYDMTPTDGH